MVTYCKDHPEYELSHICLDCNQILCIYCILEHSSKHKVTALMELATEVIQKFSREHEENAKIATEINALHSHIKNRVTEYWEGIKRKICASIDDFKADSLKFIEGVIGKKEKGFKYDSRTKASFMHLFKEKKYYDIYKNKAAMQVVSEWVNEQKKKKERLITIYNSLPSNNFNFSFLNSYLLKLEQNLYSAIDYISNSSYGAFVEGNTLSFLYVPTYVDSLTLPQPVMNSAVVQTRNSVYLIGGNLGKWDSNHLNTTYAVSLMRKNLGVSLVPKAPMNYARAWQGVATLNDQYIYAIGGYSNLQGTLHSCERYIIEKDKWLKIPSLGKKRWGLSVTIFNERKIYAFFGVDIKVLSTDIEVLDSLNEEQGWTLAYQPERNPGYFRRCHASFQSSNNEILIFGGDAGQQLMGKCLSYTANKQEINYTECECACRPHPAYFHCPSRMKSSMIYKLAFGNQAAVYDMVRKFWIVLELCPLEIAKVE